MAIVLPPVRNDISGTAPNPSNAVAREAFGKLHDYLMNLLGSAGTPAAARATLDIKQLQSIDYTLAGNALTLKLNPTNRDYRSTSLLSGVPVNVSNAAQLTLTISNGSTLGTVSGVQSDIAIISINNAGTMELAAVNIAGGASLSEEGVISTLAEGGAGAADSATVFYSNITRTGVAYRLEGIFRSTQTVAGAWAQVPTLVQPIGGQALAAMASLGYGQKWTDVGASRSYSVTYYNTKSKPIKVAISGTSGGAAIVYATFSVNGVLLQQLTVPAGGYGYFISEVVPPGASYSATLSSVGTGLTWNELI